MGIDRRPAHVVTAILAVGLMAGCGAETVPTASDISSTSAPTTTTTTTSETTPPPTTAPADADPLAGQSPLWPFSTVAEARQWQSGGEGHSPWHADAEATALAFTTGYLGFTGVDKIISSEIGATEAKVTVGYQGDLPEPAPAATLHLVRYGEGAKAPWEVVGTIDDTLTITAPKPGAQVDSPVTVSGRITGVDESIQVQVRDPDRPAPVGKACCLPAGGQNTPWSTTVPIRGASNATLTIVAATGGHVADVERFAVTGVQPVG
ncbi:MAG TPA: Gmad2 immunoglobulin-like domain-containing protein [Actinophytocola sp.]|nr:Gmad2 immunoglobulin-like domain-containing protein [Actinophytocola sp.]